jgi:hypothetical protein
MGWYLCCCQQLGFLLIDHDSDQEREKTLQIRRISSSKNQLMPKGKMPKMVRNATKCISG